MAEPEAAVAIVRARGAEESVLLMRRTEREKDPWSGHWSFPGGRRDRSDTDPLHTALRELQEECGILLPRECCVAALPPRAARRRGGVSLLVAPFVFAVDGALPTVLSPEEAVEARWVPLRLLLDPGRHTLRAVPGQPRERLFPAVEMGGAPLWGFTYRLMVEWLDLAPKMSGAGFATACRALEFLLHNGSVMRHDWEDRGTGKVAAVEGAIPVEEALTHFSLADGRIPAVSSLEVRSDFIRLVGLASQEYLIRRCG